MKKENGNPKTQGLQIQIIDISDYFSLNLVMSLN